MPIALKELSKLPLSAQVTLARVLRARVRGDEVSSKFFKKITSKLFEVRVKDKTGIYRGICGFVKPDLIVVLVFKKKTQKLPRNIIRAAEGRLKWYLESLSS